MIDKRDIINTIYVLSFPMYGIGAFVSGGISPSIGYMVEISMHVLIIVFYLVDILYKNEFQIRTNRIYVLMTFFQLSCVASLFIALFNGMPDINLLGVTTKSFLLIVPFQAFVIVFLYNEKNNENFAKLTFLSWSIVLLINLFGFYVLGLTNQTHSIEGRLAFPFLDGFYSGACLLSILNLMLLFYIKKSWSDPIRLSYLILYFLMNLIFLYLINSRLNLMIFLAVFTLFAFNLSRSFRGVFLLSIFTLPIMLNAGILVYKILSLPVFVFLMQRVDLVDVTTFNGRAFLWQRTLDWLVFDQRGVFFGNGANGQYFLHLFPDLAKRWRTSEEHMHLHSTVLMVLVDQGLFGYLLLLALSYLVFVYYKSEFQKDSPNAIFFPIVVFIIFVMQVDTFVYMGCLGYAILSLLTARIAVKSKA